MMFRRSNPTRCALCEPRWTALSARRLPGVSTRVHAWLGDDGSLTRSVTSRCDARFRVDLLSQGRGKALPSEQALLDGGPARATLVREVKLYCGREAWVFARTLLPLRSLRGPLFGLTRLGQRPLGAVLFANPTTRRLEVQVARITPRHHLFASATGHLKSTPRVIWGRRTLFDYGGERILVNELFLPPIPELGR